MLVSLLLTLASGCLSSALPPHSLQTLRHPANTPRLVTRDTTNSSCPGYEASNVVVGDSGVTADLTLAGPACNIYGTDLKDLKLVVEYQTNDRLHVKIFDADLNVYQVQEEVLPRPKNENAASSGAALQFDLKEKPFSFTVTRKENSEVIFDTSSAQLIFESQYVRLRTSLPDNPNIYGLGEHSDPFRLPTQNYERVLWNSESPFIPQNSNLYGSHPMYFDHRGAKGTHGVFLLNADAMNIFLRKTDADGQYLEYNTVGGIIDLYFLAGKQPSDVSTQYADTVGYPAMYPYWVFGFHQCKYGYWDVNYVAEVVGNYSTAGIPLEVMWTDIDYMNLRQDFTTDPDRFPIHKMRELVSTLHSHGQRYVLILDPAVHAVPGYEAYDNGKAKDIFYKNADGSDYLGVQWAGASAWPDWFNPNTQEWWTNEFTRFFDPDTGIDIDGVWVDMNEASNFCSTVHCNATQVAIDGNTPPPPTNSPRPNTGRPIPGFPADFQPGSSGSASSKRLSARASNFTSGQMQGLPGRDLFNNTYHIDNHRGNLSSYTLDVNNTNYDGTVQYDTHNLYGSMQALTSHSSMLTRRPALRPFVLTRSTFAGVGRKVNHWFGDNESSWEHYRTSIRQMLSFVSMHQMPMVGSDVCGFNSAADPNMCSRWALLSAFQSFMRNHADISAPPQEFYQWPITIEAAKKAISTRYKLMDYAYTALYRQTQTGKPMINPLFFIYPEDEQTFGIQHQWFYGDSILVSPVTDDYSDTVTFYMPKGRFYDYWSHISIDGQGENVTVSNISVTEIPVHIKGGAIIPERANSANTTKLLREEDFTLIVAPDTDGKASGHLYLDDGESIEQKGISEINFDWDNGKFSCSGTFGYGGNGNESTTISSVLVLGQGSNSTVNSTVATRGLFRKRDDSVIRIPGHWKLSGPFSFTI